jgi:hypothetical protein
MSADTRRLWRNERRVNLLTTPRSRRRFAPASSGRAIVAVAGFAVVCWGTAGVGLALLLGWHP